MNDHGATSALEVVEKPVPTKQPVPAGASRQGAGQSAIKVRELVKTYGSLRAVDGLSFTVARGEIFALLGPNGAGKTTTVEILEGYRTADSGEALILGRDPIKQGHELKQHIGLMLQQSTLYERIKVREAIELFCSYYDNPRDPEALIRLFGLETHKNVYFENLSGGLKQRLSAALAIAGNPKVACLDEPTGAMDPQMRLQTWDIIRDLRQHGVTILLTTHSMDEAQRLADRVAIIDHGRLVRLGTPEELTGVSAAEIVTFHGPEGLSLAQLRALPFMTDVREDRPGAYTLTTSNALDTVAALAAWRDQTRTKVDNLRVSGATLEDVFLRLTGSEVRD
jgi:ABC-2 type transport system ATP-binding protein